MNFAEHNRGITTIKDKNWTILKKYEIHDYALNFIMLCIILRDEAISVGLISTLLFKSIEETVQSDTLNEYRRTIGLIWHTKFSL